MPAPRPTLLDDALARCARVTRWLADRRRTHTLWNAGPQPEAPQRTDPPRENEQEPEDSEPGRHP